MNIEYIFRNNRIIQKNLIRIETAKKVFEFLPQLPHIEESLRHKSLLKSSLFSARIEGNRLRFEEIENIKRSSGNIEKKEILNILSALKWIHSKTAIHITIPLILKLHKMVMQAISAEVGQLRTEHSAIFNQAGVAVYITPPPHELKNLLTKLIKISKASKEHAVINAAQVHFAFEKIHPFIDGNGRVGRLLSAFLLKNSGFGFRGLAILEEYLNEHQEEYYSTLGISKKDITEFVEFFTNAVATSAEKVIKLLQNRKEERPEDTLLPRRQEILAIIREHKLVSFDFIKRRFQKVPVSSLHYDLKMLLKTRFIIKLGTTRGALYAPKQG